MMIHNLVKYLRLWAIKITNFKPESCPDDLLEICYFYISQTKSSLDKIFYKIVYHNIIYMCDFFLVNLDDFFAVVCTGFHEVVVCTRYVPHLFSFSLPTVIEWTFGLMPHVYCFHVLISTLWLLLNLSTVLVSVIIFTTMILVDFVLLNPWRWW